MSYSIDITEGVQKGQTNKQKLLFEIKTQIKMEKLAKYTSVDVERMGERDSKKHKGYRHTVKIKLKTTGRMVKRNENKKKNEK